MGGGGGVVGLAVCRLWLWSGGGVRVALLVGLLCFGWLWVLGCGAVGGFGGLESNTREEWDWRCCDGTPMAECKRTCFAAPGPGMASLTGR